MKKSLLLIILVGSLCLLNGCGGGSSSSLSPLPVLATHFSVTAPVTATVATAFNFTVTALDASNNTVTGYSGTVHFTSSDAQALLPKDSTLASGTGTFSATLETGVSQTITATDTATASITGASNSISVSAAGPTHFSVVAPAMATAGLLFSFTVTALDATNNVATSYAGTVHFTSSDGQATLPANSMLTNGSADFPATLKTAGSQTITATDTATASITGASNSISVSGATAENSVPFIGQPLSPTAVAPGGAAFTLTVNGSGFVAGSVVKWNGTALATNLLSKSKLTANVPASAIAAANTASVSVENPAPGGGTSNVVYFETTTTSSTVAFGTPSGVATDNTPFAVATGDFNADGKLDLAVANDYGNDVSILLGKGDGTFQPAVNYTVGSYPDSVAVGDFNGDGKLDIAVANLSGNNVSVLLGNGDGTFRAAVNYAAGTQPTSVAVADFNGDGKLDLAVANYGSNSVSVLLGNGDGRFQAPLNYDAGSAPYSLAVGDFNGDGKLDLVMANQQSSSVSVLVGNGDGTFQSAVDYAVGTAPTSVAVADFNGDGKLDLAVANSSTANVGILLGNGDGTFQPAVDYGAGGGPLSVAVGDMNGDGKLDLVVSNPSSNSLNVLLGNGDGTFQPAVPYGGPGLIGNYVAVGDFDGDGRLDLAVTGNGQPSISVFLQETTAALSPSSLNFSNQMVDTSSALQTVTLTNTGGLALNLSIGVTGANHGDFMEADNCGPVLPAVASCKIDVTFTPTQVGPRSAAISIVDDSPDSPQSVALSGTGLTSGGNATLLPMSLNFGPQLLNTTSSYQTVTLGNYGTTAINISSIAASPNFGESQACPASLGAGATCTINVTFTPTAEGNLTGTLSVTDTAPGNPQSIPLSGIGAGATTATLSPVALYFSCHFGPGPVGPGCSAPEKATLTNTGASTLYIFDITPPSISPANGFSQTNNCPSSLDPGQSCAITVSFAHGLGAGAQPGKTYTFTGTLSVNDTATPSPQQVSLRGTVKSD